MSAARERLVQFMYLGGKEMTDFFQHQGFLMSFSDNNYTISSRWELDGAPVFGADCDYTTMLISAIKFIQGKGCIFDNLKCDLDIDVETIKTATNVKIVSDDSEWQVYCSNNAALNISNISEEKLSIPKNLEMMNRELFNSINSAWNKELATSNVSQGAYISSQQYLKSLNSRLNLLAQSDGNVIWPPRKMNKSGHQIGEAEIKLSNYAKIESWTRLSAAGAPSEFSIRAPILGGISTALVKFEEGPRGVFLLVDDEHNELEIGMSCEFVIRRIYAQEGNIRYGTKIRILGD